MGTAVGLADAVAVPVALGVPEATGVGLELGVALAVAVGAIVAVAVGVGLGSEQSVKSVVQDAPSEGQQYLETPQVAVVPTFAIAEQLTSWGTPPLPTE